MTALPDSLRKTALPDSLRKKDVLRLLVVVVILAVIGIRFERMLIAASLAVALVLLFAVLGRRRDNSDGPNIAE